MIITQLMISALSPRARRSFSNSTIKTLFLKVSRNLTYLLFLFITSGIRLRTSKAYFMKRSVFKYVLYKKILLVTFVEAIQKRKKEALLICNYFISTVEHDFLDRSSLAIIIVIVHSLYCHNYISRLPPLCISFIAHL